MATNAEVFALAWQNFQAGNLARAEQLFRQILRLDPFNANVLNGLAAALVQQGKFDEAASNLRAALRAQPDNAETHNNLGSVLTRLGRNVDAIDYLRQALRLKPDYAQAHYNLGLVLKSLGQRDPAMAAFHESLRIQPDLAPAMHDLGNLLAENGSLTEAESQYRQALRLRPDRADTHHNLGCVLQRQGRLDDASVNYNQALKLNPSSGQAHFNLGTALQAQGRLNEAADSYRRALALLPDYAEAHNNLGLVLREQGRPDEAVACHRQALKLRPQSGQLHNNLAAALKEQGRHEEAIACYQAALQLEPASPAVLAEMIHQLQLICQWEGLQDLSLQVIQAVENNPARSIADAVPPFAFLGLPVSTTHRQQQQCASKWVEQRLMCEVRSAKCDVGSLQLSTSNVERRTPNVERRTSNKITIGYLSADFHEHAIARLVAELIEKHDRQHFDVFGYSYGIDDASPIRSRLARGSDRFRDLRDVSFPQTARQIQADEVDILVDLTGYTGQARTEIMALRPAPIQVNFLGFPGTMGALFIDYILVDDFVVPPDQQPYFTEKLIHLPGCYQVNDSRRESAAHTPSRAECGLPAAGFVFCCFNSSFKFTPKMFDVWMRLLKAVPGSVLWLLEANRFVPANLRREALARGVAPERLVFAPKVPMANHLARHRLADLFLDTLPYNAHTTTSDALWIGCPVLTLAGQTFASRVAGSLLRTIGLPELITTNLQEYEEMALRLAREPDLLADFRARLTTNRTTSRLFDGGQFARSLEQAYVAMWKIYTSGQSPRAFAVP
jgi:protein O-GlcNAc transferase